MENVRTLTDERAGVKEKNHIHKIGTVAVAAFKRKRPGFQSGALRFLPDNFSYCTNRSTPDVAETAMAAKAPCSVAESVAT